MVHILSTKPFDIDLMAMLYNLISRKDDTIYLIADSWYKVPKHSEVLERAMYWFSEVHLIAGRPWHLQMNPLNELTSVSIYVTQESGSIFTPIADELTMKPTTLTTRTCIINGKKNPQYYRNYLGVTEVRKDYPFATESIMMDEDLKIYNSLKSRLGDL